MKRRQFLKKTTLGAGVSIVLDGCNAGEEKLIPLLISEESFVPDLEAWTASVCRQCSAGCGIVVRTMVGETTRIVQGQPARVKTRQAKKIEGNPKHPLNRGKLCARGQAGLQVAYNPDRLREPLQRTGPRGSDQYRPITWDEAISNLVTKLRELREGGDADRLLMMTGSLPGHLRTLVERFMRAYGSPNHVRHEPFSDEAVRKANELTFGQDEFAAYDLANTRYVLSFGANFLETWLSPVHYSLGFGEMRQGRPGTRGKVVHAGPRFSLTAANADEWLPVHPGSEGSLALGLAHVIIEESLYDRQFVQERCRGFDGFRDFVLEHHSPERTSQRTGISPETIVRIAREFAAHQPGLALGGDSTAAHTNGAFNVSAILALNALLGSVDRPGGITFGPHPSFRPLPDLSQHLEAQDTLRTQPLHHADGLTSIVALMERLQTSQPSPVEVLLLYGSNPLFSLPESLRFRDALQRIPFIVSFSSFKDESAQVADLILPDHTPLESWWDEVPDPGVGRAVAGLAQPVIRPLYDTRSTADVLLQVAQAVAEDLREAFPWNTFEELLREAYQGLHEVSGSGEDFDAFWNRLLEQGGWWEEKDGPAEGRERRRFDFSPILSLEPEAEFGGDQSDYPFYLHVYPSIALSDGQGANLPWLQELPDPMTTVAWGSWVEINPKTARRLAIREGDLVSVESPYGEIRAPALLFPAARPDTIHMPIGQGHEAYGRYAERRGANPIGILAPLVEPSSGMLAWAATRVKLSKLTGKGPLVKVGYTREQGEGT